MFLVNLPRFYVQNRISREKLSDLKKKLPQSDEPFKSYAIFALQSFRKIHKVKDSRKSGVKSSFCKGHFHAN